MGNENRRMGEMGEQRKRGKLENKRTENKKTGETENGRMGKMGEQENGKGGQQDGRRTTGREEDNRTGGQGHRTPDTTDEAEGQEANKEHEALFLLPVPKAQRAAKEDLVASYSKQDSGVVRLTLPNVAAWPAEIHPKSTSKSTSKSASKSSFELRLCVRNFDVVNPTPEATQRHILSPHVPFIARLND
ncbi:uncharacterized protein EDB93DRAFT_1104552 [Suillus bovinus]|uniref:uncharacterized protein n=1 Tax=Suillus bovinus TaxID=48563 RepID=UPI001B86972A|nr:uncharacterized protein EDB93DRAFT_1104552 [Suillus bovinus]KAG2146184.1 hypothetical protein EDB93DRAFT_1104552 [Suillus bovinus]